MVRNLYGVSLVVALLIAVFALPAEAAPLIGTRAMAMGGACTAVVDDATAPYWNPAGMALHKFALASTALIESEPATIDWLLYSISKFNCNYFLSSGDFSGAIEPCIGTLSDGVNVYGPWAMNLDAFVGISSQRIGVSVYADAVGYSGSGWAVVDTTVSANLTTAAKFNLPSGPKWLALGVNGKGLYLEKIDTEFWSDSTGNAEDITTVWQGYGYAGDLGMMLQITDGIRVGAMVKDIAWNVSGTYEETSSGYVTASGEWNPSAVPVMMNIGIGLFPAAGTTVAFDLQGINLCDFKDTYSMTANIGFEQVFGPLALRVGGFVLLPYEDPYVEYPATFTVTGGLGLKFGAFHWDASATYELDNDWLGVQSLLAFQW